MFMPTLNIMGIQPMHVNTLPLTAFTSLLHGINSFLVQPSVVRWLAPVRHIPAPLSGKIIAAFWVPCVLSASMGVRVAEISWACLAAEV